VVALTVSEIFSKRSLVRALLPYGGESMSESIEEGLSCLYLPLVLLDAYFRLQPF